MRVSLVEIKLRAGGKRVRLDHAVEVESLYVGRGPDNDLSLKGLTVSLHHATIRMGDGHAYVEAAAGSEIRVNGLPTQGERISVGDEIRIGPWMLRRIRAESQEDLRIEYEKLEADDDARSALDARTRLGIERGLLSRRPLSWIAIGGVLLGFLALPLVWPSARPVWTTGPVTRGHASIENDCASCHGGLFQRVENEDCTRCHADVRRHAPSDLAMPSLEGMRCADCHLEHRGREVSLADQGAVYCVTCHATLAETLPESELPNASDFESAHPTVQLAMYSDLAEGVVRQAWSPDLREESGVAFDHQFHVTQPLDGPEDEEWLDCGQCHRIAADGIGMQPVDFDRDCRRCHELAPVPAELAGRLEHGDPERMREQLRRAFTDRILEARVADAEAPRALRERRPGRLVGSERDESARWVGSKVAAMDEALFDESCSFCHVVVGGVVSEETGEWIARSVAPVRVATRWIENARFAHAAHSTQACATCHPAAAIRDSDLAMGDHPEHMRPDSIPYGLIDAGPESVASDSSADVMIPGIETCRSCHVSPRRGAPHKVASPCSACHDFHDHELEPMARPSNSEVVSDGASVGSGEETVEGA